MTIAGTDLIDAASAELLDTTNKHWPRAQLLKWLNYGQQAIVTVKRDAGAVDAVQTLAAGTKQALPAGGIELVKVFRNMGTDTATPGPAITLLDMTYFDRYRPAWHTDPAEATVQHYLYTPDEPTVWWCWPPQPASGQGSVQLRHVALPADLAVEANDIGLPDRYRNPLLQYILYRAWAKGGKPGNSALAQAALGLFFQILGVSEEAKQAFAPYRATVEMQAMERANA